MEAFRLFDPPGCAVKVCTKCKVEKPLDEFGKRSDRPSVKSYCKPCDNALSVERKRRYRAANPVAESARLRRIHLKYKFGVTPEWFDQLLATQSGRCAICGTDNPGVQGKQHFFIDHCHTTGAVRRLLCNSCNSGIGHFREDPVLLVSAVHYLLEFQTS